MPYSTACSTTLSNFEAGQNYKDVDDPAVTVMPAGGSTRMPAVMRSLAFVAGMPVGFLLLWSFQSVLVCLQVAFVLDGDPDDAQVVAWTTTPWTLPSNLSLCVHPEMIYVRVRRLLPASLALTTTISRQ